MNKQIEIFVRHCNYSANSAHKKRPEWFSKEKCWNNLKQTTGFTPENYKDSKVNINVCFDGKMDGNHFLKGDEMIALHELENGGNDAKSFLNMLYLIEDKGKLDHFGDDTIIYILEDDYLHRPGWVKIMLEAFNTFNVDYITLYDHSDKYWLPMYEGLQSTILSSVSSHWRTTPSTTNTYACKFKTLKNHLHIHKYFCDLSAGYTRDHDKFTHLWENGSNLISSIPGYSTHCESEFLSPVINWSEL